jgi:hypothetical protein
MCSISKQCGNVAYQSNVAMLHIKVMWQWTIPKQCSKTKVMKHMKEMWQCSISKKCSRTKAI